MKAYRYFLFDLDGTLTDSGEGVLKSVQFALAHFGIEVADWHELGAFMGPPLTDSFRDFCGFDPKKSIAARDKYRERYNTIGLFENRVYGGMHELLEALRAAGGHLFVATSKPEITSRRVLDHFGLTSCFDEIVGSEMNGGRDQKAEVIREVFRRAGIGPEEQRYAIMIGDRLHDIRGAKACGIDSLGTYIGYAKPGELESEGADYIAHDVEEMRRILLSHTESAVHDF